jgi:hypothetical protein
MKKIMLLPILFPLLLPGPAFCDTYTWEDENGINFTDDLEKVPKKYRSKTIAEAREDITGSNPPVTASDQSNKNQPTTHKPHPKAHLRDDRKTQGRKSPQEQPRNIDEANDGMKYQDSYQSQGGYENNRHQYSGQSHGVEEAQRSAYESLSPARKAMNQAEERIRESRRALDAGGRLSTSQEQRHNEGKNFNSQHRKHDH